MYRTVATWSKGNEEKIMERTLTPRLDTNRSRQKAGLKSMITRGGETRGRNCWQRNYLQVSAWKYSSGTEWYYRSAKLQGTREIRWYNTRFKHVGVIRFSKLFQTYWQLRYDINFTGTQVNDIEKILILKLAWLYANNGMHVMQCRRM